MFSLIRVSFNPSKGFCPVATTLAADFLVGMGFVSIPQRDFVRLQPPVAAPVAEGSGDGFNPSKGFCPVATDGVFVLEQGSKVSIPQRDFVRLQHPPCRGLAPTPSCFNPSKGFCPVATNQSVDVVAQLKVSIPQRDFVRLQRKRWVRLGLDHRFQSLKGILSGCNRKSLNCNIALANSFQSLKGILSGCNGTQAGPNPQDGVVSIPQRDFVRLQPWVLKGLLYAVFKVGLRES